MGAKVHVCMCVCMSMRVSMCFDLWTSLGGTKVEQIWMAATVHVCLCVCMSVVVCQCFCELLCVSVCFNVCTQTSLGGTKVEQGWLGATAAKWEAFDAALLVTDTHTLSSTIVIITFVTLVTINLTKHLPVSDVIIKPSEGNKSTNV